MTLPNMLHSILGNVLVAVHTSATPSDDEWAAYIRDSVAQTGWLRANLVVTQGGGPNAQQRRAIAAVPASLQKLPSAVVTPSRTVRGIVTAISWFGKNIRAFAPGEIDDAFGYLDIPKAERLAVLSLVTGFEAQLAGSGPASSTAPPSITRALGDVQTLMDDVVRSRVENIRGRVQAAQRQHQSSQDLRAMTGPRHADESDSSGARRER